MTKAARVQVLTERVYRALLTQPEVIAYQTALKLIVEGFQANQGAFGLANESGNLSVSFISKDQRGDWHSEGFRALNLDSLGEILNQALVKREVAFSNDLGNEESEFLPKKNCLVVPVVHDNDLEGVFIAGNSSNGFSQDDVDVAKDIALKLAPVLNFRRIHVSYDRQSDSKSSSDEQDIKEKADLFLDVSGAAIVMLNLDGAVKLINRKGCEILGYEENEILGKDWFETVVPERVKDEMLLIFSSMKSGAVENVDLYNLPLRTKSGRERIVSWHSTSVNNGSGVTNVVLGSGIDITEHVRAEEDLKSAVKTAMFYLDLMGHDFKNKLQGIVLSADILRFSLDDPTASSLLDEIDTAVRYCDFLIDKVRSTDLLLSTPLIEVSLNKAIEQAAEVFRKRHGNARIDIEYGLEEAFVLADLYLQVLFSNILDNAVQHNPSNDKRVWMRLDKFHSGFEVSIADNGPGIENLTKTSLFAPERRLVGVGLQQSRQIMDKYNGRIVVDDRVPGTPEEGTVFRLQFPG
jgi:PAS domain S-box-containing protein